MNDTLTLTMNAQPSAGERFSADCQGRLDDIWRYVRASVASLHDAEDLTQDVFIHACAVQHQFNGGDLGAWLYQIARTRVAAYYRRKDVERRGQKALQDRATSTVAMPDDLDWAGSAEVLHAAIAGLDETEREALRLKFALSFSNLEIARLLQIEPSTLGVIVYRALRKLRRKLEGKRT